MQHTSPAQLRRIHQLLTELERTQDKPALVRAHTGNRTSGAREMLAPEAMNLIRYLEREVERLKPEAEAQLAGMRQGLYQTAYAMGWFRAVAPEHSQMNTAEVVWARLDTWALKYSAAKRAVKEMSRPQLEAALTQLKAVQSKVSGDGRGTDKGIRDH